jgi:hypothetical protein
MTVKDIVRGKMGAGRIRAKKQEKVVNTCYSMALQCIDTLLDCMGQRRSIHRHNRYQEIHTAMKRGLNSTKNK